MRAQANLVLLFALHLDPGIDHVLREYVALEQELVVVLEFVARFRETASMEGTFLSSLADSS